MHVPRIMLLATAMMNQTWRNEATMKIEGLERCIQSNAHA